MNAQEIIAFISNAEKKTPVKVYIRQNAPIDFGNAKVFGSGDCCTVFGDWKELQPILSANADKIEDMVVENDRRNSAVPLLDMKNINARITKGRNRIENGYPYTLNSKIGYKNRHIK